MKKFLSAVALCLASAPLFAAGSVDVRFAGGESTFDDGLDEVESEDIGFEVRGQVELPQGFFVRGRYTATESDELELNGVDVSGVDLDLALLRGGVGFGGGQAVQFYGAIEYLRVDIEISGAGGSVDDDEKGFGLFGGIRDNGKSKFLWNVEIGYVDLDDADGGSFEFNLGYRVTPLIAIVLGGQGYAIEDDANAEFDVGRGTLGVKFSF